MLIRPLLSFLKAPAKYLNIPMKNCLALIIIFWLPFKSTSQVKRDSDLYLQLKVLDSLLFEKGFNECVLEAFQDQISDDLEFYHDQGGVSTSKAAFLKDVKQNICSSPLKKPIRKLKEETLEVYPLYDAGILYGAIQKGEHEFFIKEPGKDLYLTSTAKFTHVWLLKEDIWLLKRVLSYDHETPSPKN